LKKTVRWVVAFQTLGISAPRLCRWLFGCAVLHVSRGDGQHGVAVLTVAGVLSLALEDGVRLTNTRE
jgi:hypothetical protein